MARNKQCAQLNGRVRAIAYIPFVKAACQLGIIRSGYKLQCGVTPSRL